VADSVVGPDINPERPPLFTVVSLCHPEHGPYPSDQRDILWGQVESTWLLQLMKTNGVNVELFLLGRGWMESGRATTSDTNVGCFASMSGSRCEIT